MYEAEHERFVEQRRRRERMVAYLGNHGGATVREIAKAVRTSSTGTVSIDLAELEAAGRIAKEPCHCCSRPRWVVKGTRS